MMNSSAQIPKRIRINSSFLRLGLVQAFTALGIWAVASGGEIFRAFALGSITLSMLTALVVSFEAGLTAMILFEPFRGVLRRVQYLIVPYSSSEPIHLITPVVAFFAFAFLLSRHKLDIFRHTPLAAATSILAAICFLQIFNPLQGSLSVGLVGALYYLVPMSWFYFGQAAKPDFVPRMLRFIVVLAIFTSLYGVYQLGFGYPFFEQVWLENTDKYSSISVYKIQRALATFSNSEEWGRYIQIGCLIAAGLGLTRSEGNKRVVWFGAAAALIALLALTGQRTSIFGLMLGLAILFLTGARDFRGAAARTILMLVPFVLMFALVNPLTDDDGLNSDDKFGAMLTHTSKGVVDPASEGSLSVRLETWTEIVTETLPSNPIGTGLGMTTLAATRADANDESAIDNHFLSLALSAGIPAALLLFWILLRALVFCFRGWRDSEHGSEQADLWRIMMALTATLILNNFFGTSFTIYSVAPIGWLIVGWISKAYAEMQNAPSEAENYEEEWLD
ncbi:MAG: O-antigen ligase family protein [Acidobacteriota bacterium]|nr:O-antigen ligase family protein [Acidobacteriota bacterium]